MAKIDDIYKAVDDFGLITSAEAAKLGMSRAEMIRQEKLGKLVCVARGVYRMPIWPSQPQAPYAIAVKAAGEGAFLCGESVVTLLGLAPTDPTKMRLASPRRCRRNLGPGVTLERMDGTAPSTWRASPASPCRPPSRQPRRPWGSTEPSGPRARRSRAATLPKRRKSKSRRR